MRSESTCVLSKNGHAQREQLSDGTASPLLACPPTHLRQTHTHFVKRRDSWRDRRLTEGKVKPKGYGGIARGRDTSQPRAEGEAELGLGRGAAAKILPRAHTKKKTSKWATDERAYLPLWKWSRAAEAQRHLCAVTWHTWKDPSGWWTLAPPSSIILAIREPPPQGQQLTSAKSHLKISRHTTELSSIHHRRPLAD